jgi:hypothetical protein
MKIIKLLAAPSSALSDSDVAADLTRGEKLIHGDDLRAAR